MKNIEGKVEVHNQLNPKLWGSDNRLLPEVKSKLDEIVDEFAASIDIPLVIVDVEIVGSNASYNYTENSDLDIHCIVNFSRLDADPAVVESWMWAEKKLFNDEYNISIRGINVEIYVEDIGSNTQSNGIYSLFHEKWIKVPHLIDVDIDQDAIDRQVAMWAPQIDNAISSNNLTTVLDLIDDLYLLRKNGLAIEGEYGIDNQTFKELRNLGYLDELKDCAVALKSDQLSID